MAELAPRSRRAPPPALSGLVDRSKATRAPSEPELQDTEFERIATLAAKVFGLKLEAHRRPLLQARLGRRMLALGLPDFAAYCACLEAGDPDEIDAFTDVITTNVTQFFREVHHFQELEDDILPNLMARARQGGRVRLWSAGCASGPEAYSIAGSVLTICPEAKKHDIRILATDVDKGALRQAQSSAYSIDRARSPGPGWSQRVFQRAAQGATRRVREDVANLVSFRHHNLNAAWPMHGPFDVIFCRNVAIYFDRTVQARLWARCAEVLAPGGALFLGHSERLSGPAAAQFTLHGTTSYRKVR